MSKISINNAGRIITTAPEKDLKQIAGAICELITTKNDLIPTLVQTLRACGYKAAAL